MNKDHFEEWQRYLPHFLNEEDKRSLYSELRLFPEKLNYFGSTFDDGPLQGDGWRPFVLFELSSGAKREVAGIVISNSCDTVISNSPDGKQNILFAPLQRLEGWAQRLHKIGRSDKQIESALNAIRRQEKSDILYLPATNELPECFVRLDEIRPQALSTFLHGTRVRLFSLSQAGFYILVIKLAIHFTRIQERVRRSFGAPGDPPPQPRTPV